MTPKTTRLRRAIAADLGAIVTLERTVPTAPHWPLSSYVGILKSVRAGEPQSRCLFVAEQMVDEQSGMLMGFAVGLVHAEASPGQAVGELESVAVAEDVRRAGVGRALCAAVLAWCREQGAETISLEVRSKSAGAIALYTAMGLERTGIRPHYYSDPEDDALLMQLSL